MADEAPLQLVAKKKRLKTKRDVLTCIIHCSKTKGSLKVSPITDTKFRKIKETCNICNKYESDCEKYDYIKNNFPGEYLNNVHGY